MGRKRRKEEKERQEEMGSSRKEREGEGTNRTLEVRAGVMVEL
jgi:hypothetical protein